MTPTPSAVRNVQENMFGPDGCFPLIQCTKVSSGLGMQTDTASKTENYRDAWGLRDGGDKESGSSSRIDDPFNLPNTT